MFGPARSGRPFFGGAYSDNYYHKIYIIPKQIDLGTFTETTSDFIVWNAFFTDETLSSITTTATLEDGLTLTGFSSGVMHSISVENYTLEAGEGSPSLNVIYTWDFVRTVETEIEESSAIGSSAIGVWAIGGGEIPSLPADIVSETVSQPFLTVIGQRVILLPWPALNPMTKTLSWKTGVVKSYGSEQRRGLRRAPRQEIDYSIFIPGQDRINLETRTKDLSELFAVPLWWDREAIGVLFAGSTTINMTTDNSFLNAGGLLFLYENTGLSEAKTIASIAPGVVTLTSGLTNNYTKAEAMAALASYAKTVDMSRRGTDENFASFSFVSNDYYELPANTYTQYKSLDLLLDPSRAAQPVSMQVVQSRVWRDNEIGPVSVGKKENRVRIQDTQRWITSTRAERYNLEQWFQSRYGQRVPFYQPTWQNDFMITSAIGDLDSFIDVETTSKIAPFDIMIELNDGTQFFREVLTKSVQGGGHRLNLDSALGQNIAVVDVEKISLLRLTRHASDSVLITYETPNMTRAEIPTTTS